MRFKRLCSECPVIGRCRAYALRVREPYGTRGRLAQAERDR
ncbi:MAG: WhiB family transcriptional regulator [Actinobacteria bacterium]|nr:WhiB family transcriptional regulator [Actinomycetota bacterium]